jgi:hypothetical protein
MVGYSFLHEVFKSWCCQAWNASLVLKNMHISGNICDKHVSVNFMNLMLQNSCLISVPYFAYKGVSFKCGGYNVDHFPFKVFVYLKPWWFNGKHWYPEPLKFVCIYRLTTRSYIKLFWRMTSPFIFWWMMNSYLKRTEWIKYSMVNNQIHYHIESNWAFNAVGFRKCLQLFNEDINFPVYKRIQFFLNLWILP